jgi:hypothetical protein
MPPIKRGLERRFCIGRQCSLQRRRAALCGLGEVVVVLVHSLGGRRVKRLTASRPCREGAAGFLVEMTVELHRAAVLRLQLDWHRNARILRRENERDGHLEHEPLLGDRHPPLARRHVLRLHDHRPLAPALVLRPFDSDFFLGAHAEDQVRAALKQPRHESLVARLRLTTGGRHARTLDVSARRRPAEMTTSLKLTVGANWSGRECAG